MTPPGFPRTTRTSPTEPPTPPSGGSGVSPAPPIRVEVTHVACGSASCPTHGHPPTGPERANRPGDQPLPVVNGTPSIQSLVRADLDKREQVGIQRYGTALQAHNGRNAVRDAYEEALDLSCYLKQLEVEIAAKDAEVERWKRAWQGADREWARDRALGQWLVAEARSALEEARAEIERLRANWRYADTALATTDAEWVAADDEALQLRAQVAELTRERDGLRALRDRIEVLAFGTKTPEGYGYDFQFGYGDCLAGLRSAYRGPNWNPGDGS